MKAPHTALFTILLLAAACDAGPDGGGAARAANTDPLGNADDGAFAEDDDVAAASAAGDEVPSAPEDTAAEVEASAADVAAPVDSADAANPVATADAEPAPAPSWFIKGSVATAIGGGASQAGASVHVSLLSDAGALTLVGDAQIDLDGRFSVALPASVDIDLGIAQVLDVTGSVVASTILGGAKGSVGAVLDLAPMSAETSLEVDVLLAATRCACTTGQAPSAASLALDVSALVDADLSRAIEAAGKLGVAVSSAVRGLADAVLAGVHARVDVLSDLTGELDAELRLRAQLAGTRAFSSSLSASFSVDARLDHAAFAGIHAAATLDAKTISRAVVDVLEKAGADAADVKLAIDAGVKLQADVAVALDVDALVEARRVFVATLKAGRKAGGLIGGLLTGAVDLVGNVLDHVLDTVLDLSIDLDASVTLDLSL